MHAVERNPEKPEVNFPGLAGEDSPKRVRKSKLQEKALLSTVAVWWYRAE